MPDLIAANVSLAGRELSGTPPRPAVTDEFSPLIENKKNKEIPKTETTCRLTFQKKPARPFILHIEISGEAKGRRVQDKPPLACRGNSPRWTRWWKGLFAWHRIIGNANGKSVSRGCPGCTYGALTGGFGESRKFIKPA